MIPIHKITAIIALSVMSLSLYGQKRDTIPAIKPGIQWDTAVVIKPVKASEHLLGVKYDFSFTGVTMTPEMGVKAINSPINVAVLYTYYHPLWSVIDIFGIQTGFRYTTYGFVNDD